jgi:hypothetical protein
MIPKQANPTLGGKAPDRLARLDGLAAPAAQDSSARLLAERKLVKRVYERSNRDIQAACAYSSVPPEFLGALTANESGGDPNAVRFEPAVYSHLKALATGKSSVYSGFRVAELEAEVQEVLHPKAAQFHARFLGASLPVERGEQFAELEDETLRELASSWGFTQIMGYHLIGRRGTVQDLLEPPFHFRLAVELLSEFAEDFRLDLTREFEEMFRCWNTGSPYGETFDAAYVANGLLRMNLFREMARGAGA